MKPKFIRTSTRSFFQEASRIPGYSLFERLHGYIYGRWIYLYIDLGVGEHPLAKKLAPLFSSLGRFWPQKEIPAGSTGTLADGYHGKVLPTETAKELVSINQDIRIDDLEQVIHESIGNAGNQ